MQAEASGQNTTGWNATQSFYIDEVELHTEPRLDPERVMCSGCGNPVVSGTRIGCGCNDGSESSIVGY